MKKHLTSLLILLSIIGGMTEVKGQDEKPHKIDSSMRYRWENSSRDTLDWPLTYGWRDTSRLSKGEGPLWILDQDKRKIMVEDNAWIVIDRYPAPPNCRCWGKYIFNRYLDARKHPYPKNAICQTQAELDHIKKHDQ